MGNIFKGKIFCGDCRKRHKRKKIRNNDKNIIFCCSTYDNKGSNFCRRNKVDLEFLLMLVSMKMREEFDMDEVDNKVEKIIVTEEKVEILLVDDSKPIISSHDFAQF